jgi:hypothetical protein
LKFLVMGNSFFCNRCDIEKFNLSRACADQFLNGKIEFMQMRLDNGRNSRRSREPAELGGEMDFKIEMFGRRPQQAVGLDPGELRRTDGQARKTTPVENNTRLL